jgi:hypothetical protein
MALFGLLLMEQMHILQMLQCGLTLMAMDFLTKSEKTTVQILLELQYMTDKVALTQMEMDTLMPIQDGLLQTVLTFSILTQLNGMILILMVTEMNLPEILLMIVQMFGGILGEITLLDA